MHLAQREEAYTRWRRTGSRRRQPGRCQADFGDPNGGDTKSEMEKLSQGSFRKQILHVYQIRR
jgi:hypothetical protein